MLYYFIIFLKSKKIGQEIKMNKKFFIFFTVLQLIASSINATEISNDAKVEELPNLNSLRNDQGFQKRIKYFKAFTDEDRYKLFDSELNRKNFVDCLAIKECGFKVSVWYLFNLVDSAEDIKLIFLLQNFQFNLNNKLSEKNNKTLLMVFAEKNKISLVRLLIALKADLDVKALDSSTALMFAAANGHIEICKLLVNSGANAHCTDVHNHTAHYYAHTNGHLEVAEFLASTPKPEKKADKCLIM